jgi:hypothetical protein
VAFAGGLGCFLAADSSEQLRRELRGWCVAQYDYHISRFNYHFSQASQRAVARRGWGYGITERTPSFKTATRTNSFLQMSTWE